MLSPTTLHAPEGVRAAINRAYRAPEKEVVTQRIQQATLPNTSLQRIRQQARTLVETIRSKRQHAKGIDTFLTEYALSSEEGIALMCLAESLLRIPDPATRDALIKDKLTQGNWQAHQGQHNSFFINATTWALMLTGKILAPETNESKLQQAFFSVFQRGGERIIRTAVNQAMQIMGKQFIMGETIQTALKRAKKPETQGYRYSYDMLGEAAITQVDAERYFQAYLAAIHTIGKQASHQNPILNPGISVKLSALHPRYQEAQHERVLQELVPPLLQLAQAAHSYHLNLTIDAEESERLALSLDIMEQIIGDPSLKAWQGFGFALQSYQKRAYEILDWVELMSRTHQKRIMVRLIKGAYWDSEIKKAQMLGLSDYPVFTRKAFTDVSFQACAKKMLTLTPYIYPQFATHNAYSVAMIKELAGDYTDFEFQCLHGMGKELYDEIVPEGLPCRLYAPVGCHEDLLPYLVRRLLENGANSSFVNRIVDQHAPLDSLITDPIDTARKLLPKLNQNIPLPLALFWPERDNSLGFDFTDRQQCAALQPKLKQASRLTYTAFPTSLDPHDLTFTPLYSPQQLHTLVGEVSEATLAQVDAAVTNSHQAFQTWSHTTIQHRATCLEKVAELYAAHQSTLMYLLIQEAGKTLPDCIGEIREAIDFCRYYAAQAKRLLDQPLALTGYTGETNELSLHPRGPVLCISPWNFPLAIFTGQIMAALVTGNTVIAKPAEQTPLIAHYATTLMHEAGIPADVMQCLPGAGETIGDALTRDLRIKAITFTGSTQTARLIQQTLAHREGDLIPLIAETGGMNAMIVDSSALLEQVVQDVLVSAFGSAGQRCSALRVLYVQEDIIEKCQKLLIGAMQELVIGDPSDLRTDIGPVIDQAALKTIQQHVKKQENVLYQCPLPESLEGTFMPPTVIKLNKMADLSQEIFGPVLHLITFKQTEFEAVVEQINSTGYGLTCGIHSRINQRVQYLKQRLHVGNCYVNRNMIGAVVGLQPFGGEGLSGTGPKAGGPFYLPRFCVERTFTVDTTAAGGNASLMSLPD